MDSASKTGRKRDANFTTDEKALLAQLVKKHPFIQSKLTDGKSVLKKKAEWDQLTEEFNFEAYVHKRDTNTLKRAWDNMKAATRKAARVVVCELSNSFDCDSILENISQESACISQEEGDDKVLPEKVNLAPQNIEDLPLQAKLSKKPVDYVRREAIMRLKHFEDEKSIKLQILEAQLETAESNRRTAANDEKTSEIRLIIAKRELDMLEKNIDSYK